MARALEEHAERAASRLSVKDEVLPLVQAMCRSVGSEELLNALISGADEEVEPPHVSFGAGPTG